MLPSNVYTVGCSQTYFGMQAPQRGNASTTTTRPSSSAASTDSEGLKQYITKDILDIRSRLTEGHPDRVSAEHAVGAALRLDARSRKNLEASKRENEALKKQLEVMRQQLEAPRGESSKPSAPGTHSFLREDPSQKKKAHRRSTSNTTTTSREYPVTDSETAKQTFRLPQSITRLTSSSKKNDDLVRHRSSGVKSQVGDERFRRV